METKNAFFHQLDFLLADLISLLASFVLAYLIRFGDLSFLGNSDWVRLLVFILMIDIIITLFTAPYSGIFRRSYYQEIAYALRLTIYNVLATAIIFYLVKVGIRFSRATIILTYGFYFVISLFAKYTLKNLIIAHQRQNPAPLFIIGNGHNIRSVIEAVNASDFQLYNICGAALLDHAGPADLPDGIPLVEEDFIGFILQKNINEVLIAVPPSEIDTGLYQRLVINGVTVYFDIDLITDFHPEEEFVRTIGITRTLGIGNFSFTPSQAAYLKLKRILDLIFGTVGCIFLIPLCGIVRLFNLQNGDDAPIFYTQNRIGYNGKVIRIYKFRTMVPNAEEMLGDLLKEEKYRTEWEENQKLTNDPRITKFGNFLRRTSLDEFPQLLNVLKGEMSLVGPRPLVLNELESHNGLKLYQKVYPGITGWWGCNGRSNISYQERLELEYYYVKNISLYLDILCIFRTIFSVLKREGAQ